MDRFAEQLKQLLQGFVLPGDSFSPRSFLPGQQHFTNATLRRLFDRELESTSRFRGSLAKAFPRKSLRLPVFATLSSALLFSLILGFVSNSANANTVSSDANQCQVAVTSTSGVSVSLSGGRCFLRFTEPGNNTWTAPVGVRSFNTLVIAGGGGGGADGGSGGGSGSMYEATVNLNGNTGRQFALAVGVGGTRATHTPLSGEASTPDGSAGGNSSIAQSASGFSVTTYGGRPGVWPDWTTSRAGGVGGSQPVANAGSFSLSSVGSHTGRNGAAAPPANWASSGYNGSGGATSSLFGGTFIGSGGSGAILDSNNRPGGNGGAGGGGRGAGGNAADGWADYHSSPGTPNTGGGGGGGARNGNVGEVWLEGRLDRSRNGATGGSGTISISYVAPSLALSTAANGARVGADIVIQPTIQLRNSDTGNLAASGVVVTAAVTSGTGALSGVTATTTTSGVAQFTNLRFTSGTLGSITLTYSAPGYVNATQTINLQVLPTRVTISTANNSNGNFVNGVWFANSQGESIINASTFASELAARNVTVEAQYTSNTSIDGNDGSILMQADVSVNAPSARTLTMRASKSIYFNASKALEATNSKIDVILWADTDSANAGMVQIIAGAKPAISTRGGHLVIGGGSATTSWNGLTIPSGRAAANTQFTGSWFGVELYADLGPLLSTSGGSIRMHGTSRNPVGGSVNQLYGVYWQRGEITTGSGSLTIDGATGSDPSNINNPNYGVGVGVGGSSSFRSVYSGTGGLTIIGTTATTSADHRGVSVSFADFDAGASTVTIQSDRRLQLLQDVSVKSRLEVTSDQNVFINGAQSWTGSSGGNSAVLTSTAGSINIGAAITSSSGLDFVCASGTFNTDVNTGTINSGGNIDVACSTVTSRGAITSSGSVSMRSSGGPITTSAAINAAGPVNLESQNASHDVSVSGNVTLTGQGNGLTVKSRRDVFVADSVTLTTSGGPAAFWSRSASTNTQGSQTGEGRIRFGNNTQVSTGGGAIVLAGSSSVDANGLPNGAAYVNATAFAIQLGTNTSTGAGVQLLSGGGLIRVYGETGSGSSAKQAFAGNIGPTNTIVANSGTGTQDWRFVSANTTDNVFEVWGGNLEVTSAAPANASTPAINFYVRSISASSGFTPIQHVSGRTTKLIATGTGDLNVEVTSANSTPYSVDTAEGLQFLANGGAVNVNFGANGLDLTKASSSNPIIFGAVSGNSSTSNVQITSDRFNTGSVTAGVVVRTSGQTAVQPAANSFSADPNFNSTWSFVGNGGLTFGKTGNTRAVTVSGTNSVAGNLNIIGGNLTVSGPQTTTSGGNITITPTAAYSGVGQLNSAGNISIAGGTTVSPTGAITAGGNITISGSARGTFTDKVESTGGAVSINTGSLASTVGGLYFTTGSVVTNSGAVTLTGNASSSWGTYFEDTSRVSTDTGNITINGNAPSGVWGIYFTGAEFLSTSGVIRVDGGSSRGIVMGHGRETDIGSISTGPISSSSVTLIGNTYWDGSSPVRVRSSGPVVIESTANQFTEATTISNHTFTGNSSLRIGKTTNATALTVSGGSTSIVGNYTVYGSAITQNAAVTSSAGSILIDPTTTYAGSGALTASEGTVTISGGTTVAPTGAISARDGVIISGSGNFTNSGAAITSSTGNVQVTTSGSATAVVSSNVQATLGSITFNTGGAYSGAGTLSAGTTVAVTSAGVTIGGAVLASGNVTYTSTGSLIQNANVTSSTGNVSMNISGVSATYTKATTSTITADQEVAISSAASTVNTTGTGAISAGTVRLSSSSTLTSGAPISSRGIVEILSSGAVALNANILAGSSGIIVKAAGRISSNGGTSAASPRLFGTSGGPITLWTTSSSGGVALGNFNQLSTIQSSADGADITIGGGDETSPGSNRPAGNATSTAAHGIQLGARGSSFQASDFVVRAGTGHFSAKGAYTGGTSGSWSGIEMRPGFNILAGTVTLNGESSSTNNTTSQAGIDIYEEAGSVKSVLEATKSFSSFENAINVSASSSSVHAALLGPSNTSTDNITLRASGEKAGISIVGSTSRANSFGLWLASLTIETKNGRTTIDSGDDDLSLGRDSGRIFTFKPVTGQAGGDLSITTADLVDSTHMSINTAGNVTLAPSLTSFDNAESFPTTSSTVSVGSLIVGSSTNTSDVTISAPVTSTNRVEYFAGDVFVNAGISSGSGGISLKARRDIIVDAASKSIVTSGNGDIIFWANASATGGEVDTGGLNVTINSNGGDIVIGGGDDDGAGQGVDGTGVANDGRPDHYLLGRTQATFTHTARLKANMSSGAGDIVVRAQHFSGTTTSSLSAIHLPASVQLTASSGDIYLDGIQNSGNASTGNEYGLWLGQSTSWSSRAVISSVSGNVTLSGDASQRSATKRRGIVLYAVEIYAGGDVNIFGKSPATTASFDVIGWATSTVTAAGDINLSGSGITGLEYTTLNAGGTTTLSVGQLIGGDLGADTNSGTTSVATAFTGSGALVIEPFGQNFTNSQSMADVTIATSISSMTIGKSGNTTSVVIPTSYSIAGDIAVFGGDVTVNGNQTTTASGNISLTPSGAYGGTGTLTSAGSLTISGGTTVNPRATISATEDVTISGSSSFNNSSAPITSSSGSISISSINSFASIQAAVTSTLKNVSINVERVVINAAVKATQGVVAIQPSTVNRNIKITSVRDDNVLSILPAELERIQADTLRLTNSGTGDISFEVGANLAGKVNNLAIRAGQNVTAGSGVVVVVANLGIEAGGTIDWPGTGGEASIVALNASSVTFNQSANYSVAAVDGIDPEFGVGVGILVENVHLSGTVDKFMAVTFNPPPTVSIQDKFDNTLSPSNLSAADFVVTPSMTATGETSGTPVLEGTTATRSGGTHTFNDLKVSGGTGTFDITFTATKAAVSLSKNASHKLGSTISTTSSSSFTATYFIQAGEPASIHLAFAATQAVAGETGLAPTASLRDVNNQTITTGPHSDATISISISGADGTIVSGGESVTSEGVASFPNLIVGGKSTNEYRLTFSVSYTDSTDTSVTITSSQVITLRAGAPVKLAIDSDSQSVANRQVLADLELFIQDQFGNQVGSIEGTEVTLSGGRGVISDQEVTILGDVARDTILGAVSFEGLILQGKADDYILTFSAEGLSPVTHTVELTHGVAHNLAISGPSNAANDQDFKTDVVVSILDEDGNLVTTGEESSQMVYLSSATTLTGTTEKVATAGRATFDDLRLTGVAVSKTITAEVLSPTGITQDLTVILGHGEATKLTLTTPAAGFSNRVTFGTDPIITVQDSSGNTVLNYGEDIEVTSSPDDAAVTASLIGDVDIAPSSGIASFTDLELQGKVGLYDLIFSSGDLAVATQQVSLGHGAAFDIVVSGPTNADNALDFGSAVLVVIRDQDQNVVTSGPDSSRTVLASNTDAETVLSGTTSLTASQGRATFTDLRLTGKAGLKTVEFSWQSTPSLNSDLGVELAHGVATQLVLSQAAASATNRAEFGVQPIIEVQDISGNLVNDFVGTVTVTAEAAGSNTLTEFTGTKSVGLDGSPTATFTDLGINGTVGDYTLTFEATDDTFERSLVSDTQAITLSHGVATQLALTRSAAGFVNRVEFGTQPEITVRDADGNTVLDFAEEITVTSTAVDPEVTASLIGDVDIAPSSGIASFTDLELQGKVGLYDLIFSSGDLAVATQQVSLGHGAATAVVLTGATTAANDRTFESGVVVEIQDADANRVTTGVSSSQPLTITAVSDDLSALTLSGAEELSVSGGIATVSSLKLTGIAGTKTLTASVETPALSGNRDIELGHGYATKLAISVPAANATSRAAFGVQPTITAQDVSGNPVADFAGRVSVEVSRSGATVDYELTGTTEIELEESATATFLNVGLFGEVGSYTLTYRAVDYRTDQELATATQSIGLAHGVAYEVEVSAAETIANAAPLGTVTATIKDQDGNTVTSGTPNVVLTVSGETTVSLVGAEPANAINGVATFTGISILGLQGQKTLTATVASLSNLSGSANIALTFGAATQLYLISGVEEASNRQVFTEDTVVEIRDSSGNPVDTFSGSVSIAVTEGNGVIAGTPTETVNGSARVIFSDLRLEGQIGPYVLSFTSLELDSTVQSVQLAHGVVAELVLAIQESAANDQIISGVVVELLDANENRVTSGSPLVTLAGTDLTGSLQESANEGIATFQELKFVGKTGEKIVTASISSPSVTSSPSTVTLTHGVATQMDLTTEATGVVNRAGMAQVPVVTLKDISGNPVLDSSATVEVNETSVGSAAADISGTTSREPVNGVVTFTGLGLNGQVGQYTLTFSTAGLAEITQIVELTHGEAEKLAIDAASETARSGMNFAPQTVVRILDFDGNLVSTGDAASYEISAALVLADGVDPESIALSGEQDSLRVEASGGVATFTSLRLTGKADSYTIDYTANTLTKATQQIELLAGMPESLKIITDTEPADAIAGEGFSQAIEVELLDAEGNRVLSDSTSELTATLVSANENSPRGVSSTTAQASEGVVSFASDSALNYTLAGQHKISFTVGALALVSESFTITHAAASKLEVVGQPVSLRNDIAASVSRTGSELSVRVLDDYNNPVISGPTVTIVASVTSDNSEDVETISGNSGSTTPGSALITLPDLKLKGLEGNYRLTLTASGSGDSFSEALEPIELTFGVPAELVLTQDAAIARSGLAFETQPILEIRDNSSNLVADSELVVTANVANRNMVGTVAIAASGGVVRFDNLGISGDAGTELVIYYSTEFPAGTELQTSQLIELTAGEAVSFVIVQEPETVKTRSHFEKDVSLRLLDASGNPVLSDNSTIVSAILFKELTVAEPTLGRTMPSISATANGGVVAFTDLALPVAPGDNYFLRFELGSFSALSSSFTVLPADATRMSITREPNSVGANGLMKTGDLIPIQPQLSFYDEDGYLSSGTTGTVSVEISSGDGGSLGEGVLTASIVNGVADFGGVRLVGKPKQKEVEAELYKLRFSHTTSAGVVIASVESDELSVTNAVASSLSVIRDAASGRAGEGFDTQPVIHILDRYGNIVETGNDSNLNITASARLNGEIVPVLTGQVKQAVKGIATFTSLALGGSTTSIYDLSFQVVGKSFEAATQSGVTVGYGNPTRLALTQQPISDTGAGLTRSGDKLFQRPIVEIRDSYGNLVANETRAVSITLVKEAGDSLPLDSRDRVVNGSLEAINGVANFDDLALVTRPGENYRLRFSAELLTSVDSDPVAVRHGLPVSVVYVLEPASEDDQFKLTKTGSPLNVQPVLQLLDFDDNIATEVSETVSIKSSVASGGGYVVTEDVNGSGLDLVAFDRGIATFRNLSVVAPPAEDQTLSFETVGLSAAGFGSSEISSNASSPFELTFTDPYQLAMLEQPCAGNVSGNTCRAGITGNVLEVQPVVEIQDRYGNRVTDFVGEVSVSTSAIGAGLAEGEILGVSVPEPTDIKVQVLEGLASFEGLSLVATPGDLVALNFSSTGLLGISAESISVAAAAPVKLRMSTEPVGARTGSALANQPVVHVLDRFGNLVLSDNQTQVTASAPAGSLSVAETDSLTVVVDSGVASFQGLKFTGTPKAPYNLNFAGVYGSTQLTGVSSETFSVTNADANGLIITSQPNHVTAAIKTGDLLGAFVLRLEDFAGNLAEDDNSTVVEVSLVPGSGSARFVDGQDQTISNPIGSSILRATANAGVVTFDNLRIVGEPGTSYQIAFTANPDAGSNSRYSSVPSAKILLTHANPHSLLITDNPVGAQVNEALSSQPALRVLDRYGNLASTDNQTQVIAGIYSGSGGSLVRNFTAVARNGVVEFSGLAANGVPGERYKLAYSSGSLEGARDQVGFTMSKVASLSLSYARVAYEPDLLVAPNFTTDSPATPVFTTSSASSVCVVSNSATGAITIKGAGTCLVNVMVPGTQFYLTNQLNQVSLIIDKADQGDLEITSPDNVDFMATMTPTAIGGSGDGRLSFLVEGDCRIIGGVLLPEEAGSFCEITARKLSDTNYKVQFSEPMTITVNKISQTPLRIQNHLEVSVGQTTLITSGGSGDGEVSFQISTPGNAGCSISGDVLRATSNGSCGVMATKATSKNHLVAISAERVFTFTRAEQRVFFTSAIPATPLVGGSFTPAASLTPAATAESPRPITYSITEGSPVVCRFDTSNPTRVNFLAAGRCQITATQAGNDQFAQASADLLIVVGAKNQTISFGALAERRFGQPAFMLEATASSNLPVSYQLETGSGPQACTVTTSGLVTLVRAGDCNITATQSGNSEFLPAPPVTQLLRIAADTAGAPHIISISGNNQSITASFNPPSYLGGSDVVGYRLEVTDVQNPEDRYLNPGCSASGTSPLSCTIVGIPSDRSYTVRVAAITQAGIGTYSQVSMPISTTKNSQAVSNLIVTPSSGQLKLDWSAPDVLDGGFTGYEVFVWPIEQGADGQPESPTDVITSESDTSVTFTTVSDGPQASVRSLLNLFSSAELSSIVESDGYYVRVVTLTEGASTQVSENTTTGIQQSLSTPGELSALELTYLTDELLVAWSTPAFDGGHSILGYQLRLNGELACELTDGQQYCSEIEERMFTLGRLALGHTYDFEVAAVNERGVGVFSSVSHEMPPIPVIPPPENPDESNPTDPSRPTIPGSNPGGSTGPGSGDLSPSEPEDSSPSEPEDTVAAPTTPPTPPAESSDEPQPFDPLGSPEAIAALTSTLANVAAMAGAIAAAAAAGAAAGGSRGGSGGGSSGGSGEGGSIATIDAAHEKYKNRRRSRADRWKIWKKKWLNFIEKPTIKLAVRSARFSPLFSKIVVDGAYLRASLGSFSLLPTLFGAVVAVWSALSNTTDVAPPQWQWLIVIAVLGIFDAFAGFVSTTLFVVTTLLMHGAIPIEDVRLLLGVVIVGYGPALLANAFRAFRKEPEPGDFYWWERLVDFAVLPFIGGWVTASMIATLPALAGTTLVIENHTNDFALAVAAAIMLRVILEEAVARFFPQRLDTLHPTDVDETDPPQKWISVAFRLAVFIFVTAALMGNVWQVWVGSALFILPTIIGFYSDRFRNFPWIWRLLPTGIPGLAFTLLVASATTWVVGTWFGTSPDLALWSFALLPIPMLVLAVLAMLGREGNENEIRWIQRPQFKWLYRIGGVVMLLVTMNLAGVI